MNHPPPQKPMDVPVGFAGMRSMVSDVEALLLHARQEAAAVPRPTPKRVDAAPAVAPQADRRDDQIIRGREWFWRYLHVWALGVIILFSIAVMIYIEVTKEPPIPATARRPSLPGPAVPVPPPAPLPEVAQSSYREEKPPIGSSLVLSVDQIQYCLAETIRLEAAQLSVHDTDDVQIVRDFNDMVDDYNRRCVKFRYRGNAMEVAKAAVERRRSAIVEEGVERIETANGKSHMLPAATTDFESQTREDNAQSAPKAESEGEQLGDPEAVSPCSDRPSSPACRQDISAASEREDDIDERIANLKRCLTGEYPFLCDRRRLTAAQVIEVDAAERQAMLKICLDGRSPARCDESVLTTNQREKVRAGRQMEGG